MTVHSSVSSVNLTARGRCGKFAVVRLLPSLPSVAAKRSCMLATFSKCRIAKLRLSE